MPISPTGLLATVVQSFDARNARGTIVSASRNRGARSTTTGMLMIDASGGGGGGGGRVWGSGASSFCWQRAAKRKQRARRGTDLHGLRGVGGGIAGSDIEGGSVMLRVPGGDR